MTQDGVERRTEQRVRAALRVDLENNATGVTRDVSASGIFFETDASFSRGSLIRFDIDIDAPGGGMVLGCRGEILRVEQLGKRLGVAVRILESILRPSTAAAKREAARLTRVAAPRPSTRVVRPQNGPRGLGDDE